MLIAGRVLQGAGAAPMLSLSLALVCNAFPAAEQARALGIWAAVSAVALAIGPLAGGVLVEIDWRVIFWMNLPVAAVGIAITRDRRAGVDRPRRRHRDRLGRPGGAHASASPRSSWRWSSRAPGAARSIAALAAGRASLALLGLLADRAPGRATPIVDFALFRNGPYFGASAAAFALVGAYWAVMFFQPQYLQDVRGHSPIAQRAADPADHRADDLHLALLRPPDRAASARAG